MPTTYVTNQTRRIQKYMGLHKGVVLVRLSSNNLIGIVDNSINWPSPRA